MVMVPLLSVPPLDLNQVFSGVEVTEGQYIFEGRSYLDQEQKLANYIIDPETGLAM